MWKKERWDTAVAWITLACAVVTVGYLYVDHENKPHLSVVFTNESKAITTHGVALGGGLERVNANLYLRNDGNVPATNVWSNIHVGKELYDAYRGGDTYSFTLVPGSPVYYDARKNSPLANQRTRNDLGALQFDLPPGNYTIGTEIDCTHCGEITSGELTLTVD